MVSIIETHAKVIRKTYIEDEAVELLLALEDIFSFDPGQFVMIEDEVKGSKVRRAYSIASPPSLLKVNKQMKLCIKKKPGGLYSTFVYDEMEEGHYLKIQGPFGEFKLSKAPTKRYYFIAVGSGIAPFRSMIFHLLETKEFEKIVLIYGNKYEKDILYNEEWKKLSKKISSFEYVPVLSRESKPSYLTGHVQDHLPHYLDENGSYFICGMPKMVEEVKSFLENKVAFVIGEGY